MSEETNELEPEAPDSRPGKKQATVFATVRSVTGSARFSQILGFIGEALITVGAVVLLFLAWQLWINNAVLANEQAGITKEQSLAWATVTPTPQASSAPEQTDFGPPPAFAGVAEGQRFANIYIPRLGPDTQRAASNGVDPATVLNRGYYGRYPDTQWPGEPGNFALAIHRTGWGSGFANVPQLRAGDKIYVETADGYYIYVFRNYEYVLPTAVDVILPVPGSGAPPGDQMIITLTTCNPLLGDAERLITYGVFDSWRPRSAGPPAAIAALVAKEES